MPQRNKKGDAAFRIQMSLFDAQLIIERAMLAYEQQFAGKPVPPIVVARYNEMRDALRDIRRVNARVDETLDTLERRVA
jgi:hypothetical protein